MARKITPFLWFDDNAEEAANFYVSVFPNSEILSVSHYGEASPGPAGSVMVVSFRLDGQELDALNGGPQFAFTEAVSFVIDCANQEEVDYYWARLTEGGKPGPCGWLKDRFGLSWQVVGRGPRESQPRDAGDAPDGQAGHRQAPGSVRTGVAPAWGSRLQPWRGFLTSDPGTLWVFPTREGCHRDTSVTIRPHARHSSALS
jgi:predicted 3-demethylubiquinone-9 3-methyltransferase (glyoxalase superfamily)